VKLAYDPRYNMAYIHLKEKTADVETVHISEELKPISTLKRKRQT
jgi:uncharacterized protein YuzE